eukprot:14462799-Heterocapsa_arctica.AAC.1
MPIRHAVKAKRSARVRDLAKRKLTKSPLARAPLSGVKTLETQLFMPDPILLNEAQVERSAADANAGAGG